MHLKKNPRRGPWADRVLGKGSRNGRGEAARKVKNAPSQ